MTGFVSPPPLNPGEIAPPPTADTVLQGDAFWPEIDLVALRDVMRLDTTVSIARLRDAAISAVLSVRRELAAWKAEQLAAGRASLDEVPGDEIEGDAAVVFHYRRAVYSSAAAELLERLRELGATNAGHDRADELQTSAGEHRRAERYAIRDLLGVTRVTAELI